MTQQIKYSGVVHTFPDDFTEAEIAEALAAEGGGQPKFATPVEAGKYTPAEQAAAQEYLHRMRAPSSPGWVAWAQGALQGYGDELGGAVGAAASGFAPGSYTAARDRAREVIGAAEAVAPAGAKLAGNLSSGIPAALATGGTSLPAVLAAGGVQGGVNAYGETKENDLQGLADTAEGTAMGTLLGGIGYGAGKILEKLLPRGLAVGSIMKAMSGSVDDLVGKMKQLGASAAEVDEVLREVLRAQASKNSQAAVRAVPAARERLAQVNTQATEEISNLISPENVAGFTKRTQQETRNIVRPGYEAVEANPARLALTPELQALPGVDEALGAAEEVARFNKKGFDPNDLTVEDLDVMQRFLRLKGEKAFEGDALETLKGTGYSSSRDAINDLATDISPELAASQKAVALQKSVDKATELGKRALDPAKEAVEVAEEFASLSPEAQAGYRAAFASRLRAQMATKGTKANAASVLDKPGTIEKMKALGFPAEAIDAIVQRGEAARGVLDALIGGSQTARLTAAQKAGASPFSQVRGSDLGAAALTNWITLGILPLIRRTGAAAESNAAGQVVRGLTARDPNAFRGLMMRSPQAAKPKIGLLSGSLGAAVNRRAQ